MAPSTYHFCTNRKLEQIAHRTLFYFIFSKRGFQIEQRIKKHAVQLDPFKIPAKQFVFYSLGTAIKTGIGWQTTNILYTVQLREISDIVTLIVAHGKSECEFAGF